MTRFVIYLTIFSGFFGPGPALAVAQPPPHNLEKTFDFACNLLDADCSGIPLPEIIWTPLFSAFGALGAFDGGNIVYMDNSVMRFADPIFVNSILAHEVTHYIDFATGVTQLPWTKDNVCQSEFRAWRVGNAYVLINGRADLVDYAWAERYGCFQ